MLFCQSFAPSAAQSCHSFRYRLGGCLDLATLSIGSNVEASVAASLKEASGKADC
ncbi:MAG: hypothetical protein R2865_15860 [Deinococcales bacterium]